MAATAGLPPKLKLNLEAGEEDADVAVVGETASVATGAFFSAAAASVSAISSCCFFFKAS